MLDRAKRLKGSQFDNVFVRRDLTYAQRMELRLRCENLELRAAEPVRQAVSRPAEPVHLAASQLAEPAQWAASQPAEPAHQAASQPAEPARRAASRQAEPVQQAASQPAELVPNDPSEPASLPNDNKDPAHAEQHTAATSARNSSSSLLGDQWWDSKHC